MKMICYCADDYALNDQISLAVRILLEKNAIQATSCMPQSPQWKIQALNLIQLKKKLSHTFDIGLHLNFTQDFNLSNSLHYSLSELMFKAWSKTLDFKSIKQNIAQQWDLFVSEIGHAPDFVDGHQHIHQFPIIREALFEFLTEQNFKGWIRNLNQIIPAKQYRFKSQLLKNLGAKKTLLLGQNQHIPSNDFFSGIYDFKQDNYAELMQQWMAQAKNKTLIMCHPATDLPDDFDEIQTARINEFNYFNSAQFKQDCQQFNIELKPMGKML